LNRRPDLKSLGRAYFRLKGHQEDFFFLGRVWILGAVGRKSDPPSPVLVRLGRRTSQTGGAFVDGIRTARRPGATSPGLADSIRVGLPIPSEPPARAHRIVMGNATIKTPKLTDQAINRIERPRVEKLEPCVVADDRGLVSFSAGFEGGLEPIFDDFSRIREFVSRV
jgi:hypothetical protein